MRREWIPSTSINPAEESHERNWGRLCVGIMSRRAGRPGRSTGGILQCRVSLTDKILGFSVNISAGREKAGKKAPEVIVSKPA